jgi:heme/copper-type cytochrome/quinol oxidase subunit 2
MQMTIVVESEEDYNSWLAEQKTVEEKGILVGLKEAEKTDDINLLAENK